MADHSSTTPMPNMGSCYDPDIESFLNLDQITYSEPARPKANMASQPAMPNSEFITPDMRSASFASTNGQSPLAFQAPSHQYDDHKQQTGLPPGALAHAMTFNNNNANANANATAHQVNGMGFGAPSPGFAMNNAGGDLYGQVKHEEPLDFNAVPTRNPSEMDLEGDNIGSVPGYYFSPNSNNNKNHQFIDPNALGGAAAAAAAAAAASSQEVVPASHSTQVGRMYPGMHQQAAMAKAQQQKQHEMLRHQHQHQQQQQFHQQQQQQQRRMDEQTPTPTPQQQPRGHRNPDPVVEERISRLLQQIRQNSGSPGDSPSPSMLPQMAKAKKEEQDMDEDERLLASEEGKKLSSKERRQLRNKVSARAFRSRRKEYIGQLESEIASRTNETHDLRMQNRALYEENARLTDLAHMLLSSPHFSNFMEEMNANQGSQQQQQQQQQPQPQPQQAQPQQQQPQAPQPQQQPQQQQPQPQPQPPKESNAEFQMQQNPVVMVPNQGMDMSAMGLNNGGWNSGIDMNFANTPVFAVTEVPEGPALDAAVLSGKSSSPSPSSFLGSLPAKDEAPVLERAPVEQDSQEVTGIENPDVELDESDPAFALFLDSPVDSPVEQSSQFDGVQSEKIQLVVASDSRSNADEFAQLCLSMEEAFQRVSTVTSHLL